MRDKKSFWFLVCGFWFWFLATDQNQKPQTRNQKTLNFEP